MRLKLWLFFIVANCFLLFSCSKESENATDNDPVIVDPINLPPNEFVLIIENLSDNSASLIWEAPIDPENDNIVYSIYLNDILLIENSTDPLFEFENLTELTIYNVLVVAKDSNNNKRESFISFTTKKYYLKFLNEYTYSDINEVSSGSPYDMLKMSDDSYIIAGKANLVGHGNIFYILKIDNEGNELWKKTFNYSLHNTFQFKISETSEGFIIAAHYHVLHIDQNGNLLWYKKIDSYDIPTVPSEIKSVSQDNQGNFYLVGGRPSSLSDVYLEAVLTKLDNAGDILWEICLCGL